MTAQEIAKAKIGDRVKFVSLDEDVPAEYGRITHKLGVHVEVTWDDGSTCTYDANPASCVSLA